MPLGPCQRIVNLDSEKEITMRVSCHILRCAAKSVAGIGCLALPFAASIIAYAAPEGAGSIVCEGKYGGHLQGTDAAGTNMKTLTVHS